MNLNALTEEIKQDEGLSLTLYKDSVGISTIGYGTNITRIDMDEALWLLQHRLALAAQDLIRAFPWVAELDDARQNVLINMTYNLGIERLGGFKNMLAAAQRGDFATAAAEMLSSLWAQQVGPRATRLAETMRKG